MVDQLTLQTMGILLTGLTVSIAAIYYMLTLRYTRMNMKATLETRQAQLYMAIYQDLTSSETVRKSINILNMEWRDYDDFERKYGSDNNPESYVTRYSYTQKMNSIGWLVRSGLIDKDWLNELYGWYIIWIWTKFEPIYREQARRYKLPDPFKWFEYLYNEMKKVLERKGEIIEVPETFAKYVPDK